MTQLADVFSNRTGRDGRGVPRPGSAAGPSRRGEGLVRGVRARSELRRTLPPRGAERRQPQPPEHRRHLRLGPGARHVLHRHGVRARALNARRRAGERAVLTPADGGDRRRDRRRARVRAPQRRGTSRRQARQRAGHRRGRHQGHRLRHRPGRDERGAHADGRRHGNGGVFLPRAGPGSPGRRAVRRLLPRGRAVRDGHRVAAVHRREPRCGRLQTRARGPRAAGRTRARSPSRPRAHHPHRDGEGRRLALPDR